MKNVENSENKTDILGIIGGSGLYQMEGLTNVREESVDTPFGSPSDKLVFGEIKGKKLVFLPRHGKGHRILPSEINYAANIYALKVSGVKKVISVSAVGSLKKEIKPGDMVIVDQFFDFTKNRKSTFFGGGIVAHVSMAEPVCPYLRKILIESCKNLNVACHEGGTYICIEGPQFSTKAESYFYKNNGFDVIGMTNATEAKFAKEAELCYATIAMATDYDCWHEEEENVTADMIIKILLENAEKAKKIIKESASKIDFTKSGLCSCNSSLRQAVVTAKKDVPDETLKKLSIFNLYD
ncbi:MAG: S-methyl-5'-thioadenosine phosphorylase [Candidatus Acidulodesulfobacterium acidiphilum]|jgi:5'-methylthioadenosine phosphorylase|uniref:S-methyl-5'-thioadenosine phosphorylase n=1 Tax=Candidatus Acidulodesulfobacterium acidiphilum TaxID=2597224 RepID=A0A520XBF2_9DELT|nr:S-methyl-5'-thioadenosine phosphorylase [Deltaproteobacteria bacterium]RZV38540.1 MAG: S-methyl-5'-thioadenosine phosphorylase [Candidatus Acidulodesulfobacterium acidiphilum]